MTESTTQTVATPSIDLTHEVDGGILEVGVPIVLGLVAIVFLYRKYFARGAPDCASCGKGGGCLVKETNKLTQASESPPHKTKAS